MAQPNVYDHALASASTPTTARSRLLEVVRYELLGPERPDEVLTESPIVRYLTGMLAPFGTGVPAEEQDESATQGEGDEELSTSDAPSPLSQAITPSSIGVSFLVPQSIETLELTAEWGDYVSEEVQASKEDDDGSEDEPAAKEHSTDESAGSKDGSRKRRRPRRVWRRIPRVFGPRKLELAPDQGLTSVRTDPDDRVRIEHLSRTIGDSLAVSVFLVNRRPRDGEVRPGADLWLFQPKLVIKGLDASAVFLPRELEPGLASTDSDLESNRLLFRNRREFAIGHGCSAEWTLGEGDARAGEVRTALIPSFELPRVDPLDSEDRGLDMATLAALESGTELKSAVEPMIASYESWIEARREQVAELAPDLKIVGSEHISACEVAAERMRIGLEAIANDDDAFRAFRFANHAMLLQRSHSDWSATRSLDAASAPDEPDLEGRWRPFQLGFILLNAASLVDGTHPDRGIGDLLWFPTGGGKTEAYLGLTAFCLALRRLRPVPGMRTDAGVTVLMRYTLRLLTIQQFQRAATLICACEVLRERDPVTWGDKRFSVGLWVGMAATPNSHADSRRALNRLRNGESQDQANPCQLERCPWCGESLSVDDYWDDGLATRTRVRCPRDECEFSDKKRPTGLPLVVVDEEIYLECPSLLIATVDKFAQMPWNGNTRSLFGFIDRECSRCGFLTPGTDHASIHRSRGQQGDGDESVLESVRLAPPDLIIQDELHLISGPLGTLMGLYETTVDFLASRRDGAQLVRPKVIASTATIRRAYEQVQAVFDRRLHVFPPAGIDPEDSHFAKEQRPGETSPGRLYVGVSGPGKSMKTALIRVGAALLSASAGLKEADSKLAEPYLTLVAYFNSLRELGGAVRLVEDDIPARLSQLEERGLPHRGRPVYIELTSRIASDQIPARLQRLSLRHDAPRDQDDPLPLDAVLASSMLSVGIDISRLGLMVVQGQPKTTAEYVQATSRVGREAWAPGLVITVYNWSRPRDLSHYERFHQYHATLYRSIEAVSATPFSSRARDRALRPVFTAASRLREDEWAPEEAADMFDPARAVVTDVNEEFRRRAEAVADSAVANEVETALSGVADEWDGYAHNPLRYGWRSPDPNNVPPEDVLLRRVGQTDIGHWPAPESLREVEEQSAIYVLGLDAE